MTAICPECKNRYDPLETSSPICQSCEAEAAENYDKWLENQYSDCDMDDYLGYPEDEEEYIGCC